MTCLWVELIPWGLNYSNLFPSLLLFSPLFVCFFFWHFKAAGFAVVEWEMEYLCTWFLFFLVFWAVSCLSPSSGFLMPDSFWKLSYCLCVLCYLSVGCLSQAKSKCIPAVFKKLFWDCLHTLISYCFWFFFLLGSPVVSGPTMVDKRRKVSCMR